MVALGTELGSQGATDEVAIKVVPILAQRFLEMFKKVTKFSHFRQRWNLSMPSVPAAV